MRLYRPAGLLYRLVCLCAAVSAASLDLSDYVLPSEEAPEALLELEIGDEQVEVFVVGTWNAGMRLGTGVRVGPGRSTGFPVGLSPLTNGFVFEQTPDVTFSVWLMDRYFAEASVRDVVEDDPGGIVLGEIELGKLRVGYENPGEGFLRHLRAGNRGIGISPYPYVRIADQQGTSFGVEALLGDARARHELLVRYDSMSETRIVFVGSNRVAERRVRPESYQRGQCFVLPDAAIGFLAVYLEDPGGVPGDDGKRYRLAGPEEAVASGIDGTVFITNPHPGRVLVYYRDGEGREVGSAAGLGIAALPGTSDGFIDTEALSQDFAWETEYLGRQMVERRVIVSDLACLKLWEPGEFSPFEIAGSYDLPEGGEGADATIDISVVRRGGQETASLDRELQFHVLEGQKRFLVSVTPDIRSDMRNRYPFPDPDHLLYGPGALTIDGYLDFELLVGSLTPVESYILPGRVVPGSVRVTRNGIGETGFVVDSASGDLTFSDPVSAGDRMEVTYRNTGEASGPPQVLLAWGNHLSLWEHAGLDIAAGVRWNGSPYAYVTEAYESTGSVVASAELAGSAGNLSYKVAAAASYTQPDASGYLRLLSMEGQGLEIVVATDAARPSSVPVTGFGPEVSAGSRGSLLYKDYRSYDFLGTATLMGYATDPWPPGEQQFAYVDGGKIGPYLAGGGSEGELVGRSLVLDFSMDSDETWVGAMVRVGQDVDLGAMRSLVTSFLGTADQGEYDIYLQLGSLSEDLDGDGVLDAEVSPLSAGFAFDDSSESITLLVGGSPRGDGNERLDTEDLDGNGFLDMGTADRILTIGPSGAGDPLHVLADASTVGQWVTRTHFLSDPERSALTAVRALRVLIVKSSPGPCSGRVLVDRVHLAGNTFWVDLPGAGDVRAREVVDAGLGEVFGEAMRRFHDTGETQEVLEIAWAGVSDGDFTLRGFPEGNPGNVDYGEMVFYASSASVVGSGPDPRVIVSLTDHQGRGVHCGVDLAVLGQWREIVARPGDAAVWIDGELSQNVTVSRDPLHGVLTTCTIRVRDASDGVLYLDEVHLRSPRGRFGGTLEGAVEYRRPGPVVAVGGLAVLGNISIAQRVAVVSEGFAGLYGAGAAVGRMRSYTALGARVLWFGLEGFADIATPWGSGVALPELGGGHTVVLPATAFPVVARDTFSVREWGGIRQSEHEWGIDVAAGGVSGRGFVRSIVSGSSVTQEWTAGLGYSGSIPLAARLEVEFEKRATGFAETGTWYGAWWVEGYRLVVPWTAGLDTLRRGEARLGVSSPGQGVAGEISGLLGFRSSEIGVSERREDTHIAGEARLDLRLGEGWRPFTLTAGYRRDTLLTSRPAGGTGFAADIQEAARLLSASGWLLVTLPGADILSLALAEELSGRLAEAPGGLRAARHVPEVFLSFSRGLGSHWVDLVVPSLVGVTVGRAYVLEEDLVSVETILSARVKTVAANLFGRRGAYQVFSFYDSDEVSLYANTDLGVREPGGGIETLAVAAGLSAALRIDEGSWVRVDDSVQGTSGETEAVENTLRIRVDWEGNTRTPLRLPQFLGTGDEVGALQHEEEVEIRVRAPMGRVVYCPVMVVGRHATSAVFSERGFLKAHAAIGAEVGLQPLGTALTLAAEGGIEVELRF